MVAIPNGFEPHTRRSPFTDPFEPLYARVTDDQYSLGTVLRAVHCNSRGLVHGGFIATLVDNAMGLTCGYDIGREGRKVSAMVTVNLSVDYTGRAKVGDWVQTDSRIVKRGATLAFVETRLITGVGDIVARANATFKFKAG